LACPRESYLIGPGPSQVPLFLNGRPIPTEDCYSLLATENHAYFRTFVLASVAGIYSLFPLLFTPAGGSISPFVSSSTNIALSQESLVELVYSILWAILVLAPIQRRVYE
jgi:alpha-1,3-glucosyltransferase